MSLVVIPCTHCSAAEPSTRKTAGAVTTTAAPWRAVASRARSRATANSGMTGWGEVMWVHEEGIGGGMGKGKGKGGGRGRCSARRCEGIAEIRVAERRLRRLHADYA